LSAADPVGCLAAVMVSGVTPSDSAAAVDAPSAVLEITGADSKVR
jgi:hypothetical protein